MLYNFLDPKLTPKLVCKAPCMENYEANNLISDNFATKCRGFIAYSSIKPPVEIDFEFICPVNVRYIKINATVGSQKTNGIEIFAKSRNLTYASICSAVFEENSVVFCNSKFYSKLNPPCNLENMSIIFFKSNMFKYFLNADGVRLRIFRTNKSVPCLGSVEVWGEVSKACTATTKETIDKIMNKKTEIVTKITSTDDFKIPDDFKDDLTYEIMTIPVTLPSGKTIDRTTLDKMNKSEEELGRKPCDPFTGIKFTNSLKPILNVALKSRIDMFLLQNSHRPETFGLKRTLGGTSTSACVSYKRVKIEENDDDLERAIKLAKSDPKFTSYTEESSEKVECYRCKANGCFYYKLPCDHIYCRLCLLEICKKLECTVCKQGFIRSDVTKFNL